MASVGVGCAIKTDTTAEPWAERGPVPQDLSQSPEGSVTGEREGGQGSFSVFCPLSQEACF